MIMQENELAILRGKIYKIKQLAFSIACPSLDLKQWAEKNKTCFQEDLIDTILNDTELAREILKVIDGE